jgi:outer membrane protein assembly factor BamB
MRRTLLGTVAGAWLVACSGGAAVNSSHAFSPDWQNDAGKSIAAVYGRVQSATLPAGAAVAVGVSKDGLVGVGLDGSGRWTHAGRVDELPALSGDVVVATSGGKLFALDAKSGNALWSVDAEGRFVRGAGDDGATTVVSLGRPGGGASLVMAVSRDGSVRQKLEATPELGVPAAQGDIAFVPWQSQYVSAIDLKSGNEVGRLLLREQVSQARNIGGTLYFGQATLTRFDADIAGSAQGRANAVKLPERELPGKPVWFGPGSEPEPSTAAARERIHLYARPADQGGKLGIAGGRYVATYFRVVIGLDAADGSVRWVQTFDRDVIGGSAAQNGFAFCNTSGVVVLVDSNGGIAGDVKLGQALTGCTVQAGGFSVPSGKPPGPLAEQLAGAIKVREAQMATAQRFLLRELGAMQEPMVTKALVELASDPRTTPLLLGDARELLAARRNGAEYMLEALSQHYDFLGDVLRSPPVGPIADALSAMNETRAAEPLAKHLNDAANTPDDIERAARALTKLATPGELGDLETFFALYRATADDKPLVNAVLSVAKALLRVGGDQGKRIVADAANDPLTQPDVKAGLANLSAPPAKSPPAAPAKPEAPAKPDKPEKKPTAKKG